jgi:ribosomal protein S18 acetylase RimI-like enzyme
MENLNFVQLQKGNQEHYELLENLMIPYNMELNAHKHDPMVTEEFIKKIAFSSLNMQGPSDRHLELCYSGDNLVGFLYGKVDHEDHKGHKKPGFGYVMEFYVKPEYRRTGFGMAMFRRLERLFAADGATSM